jgi:hypothetical protein
MASVFKLGRDKKKRNAPWHLEYKDEFGKKRMKKGFTDKGLTEKLAAKLEMEAHLRTMGLIDKDAERLAEQKKTSIEESRYYPATRLIVKPRNHKIFFTQDLRLSFEATKNARRNATRLVRELDGSGLVECFQATAHSIWFHKGMS